MYIFQIMFRKSLRKMGDKFTALWIGNLDKDVTEEDIRQKFSPYGKIVSLRIPRKENDGRIYGCATCVFDDPSGYDKAIRDLDGTFFKGQNIVVQYYNPNKRTSNLSSNDYNQKGDRYHSSFNPKNSFQNDTDDIYQPRNREKDFETQMDIIVQKIITQSDENLKMRQLSYLIRWAKASKKYFNQGYDDSSEEFYDKRRLSDFHH